MAASRLAFSSVENRFLKLDYPTSTGPRIVGLFVAEGIGGNLLAETPNVHRPTPPGEYYLQGGHRLWTAPGESSELEETWRVFVRDDSEIFKSARDLVGDHSREH